MPSRIVAESRFGNHLRGREARFPTMSDVSICRSTGGETVAEVDLDDTSLTVPEIVRLARHEGADLVWAHGGDPHAEGFLPKPGYAHLHAQEPVSAGRLPPVEPDVYGPLLARAYAGQWGHKWVDPARPLPGDGSVVLCLSEDGVPIGLCRVWPDQRLVDQPGVVPERRGTTRTLRLLGAACALLGPGPVDVDSWGESSQVLEACGRLGFAVTEQRRGWELRL
jgi:hypothetical protein